ncbi:uncharacterized protein LY89DRAFT_671110 [Mollisia scopiformis]|uniref:Uncharacterized protein n=1 Tax=Mollisia scopiformis TaxID=149040 RepID=A0A194X3A4_MOLSC|nr:uncharacterized protein LY89DRAFT_671110 [Mollisia scopiformis]KUJ14685.1 hypothetical protein LY89DRAFT_671110 [Mollisia scopiformis]
MCILYSFQYLACHSVDTPQGHFSEVARVKCVQAHATEMYACPNLGIPPVVVIPWPSSHCDRCWTPADNSLPKNLAAVDLDRSELRALAKRYLAAFLDHRKKHGKDSNFQLNRETFASLQVQFVEEAQSLYRALENKIRWDSQQNRFDHSLAEKHLIIDLRWAVQTVIVEQIFARLPPSTSSTPYDIFCGLTHAQQQAFFAHAIKNKATHDGYEDNGRELVTPLCACPKMPRDQLNRLTLEHDARATRFVATCQWCSSTILFMAINRNADGRPATATNHNQKPWWLLMLQGVSAIAPVGSNGEPLPGGVVRRTTARVQKGGRAASSRVAQAGQSLLKSLTNKKK